MTEGGAGVTWEGAGVTGGWGLSRGGSFGAAAQDLAHVRSAPDQHKRNRNHGSRHEETSPSHWFPHVGKEKIGIPHQEWYLVPLNLVW